MIVLPGARTEDELHRLAERQVQANRLDTCLILGAERAVYYYMDGSIRPDTIPPPSNLLVCDKLQPAEEFRQTPEFVARVLRLRAHIEALKLTGYMLGDSAIGNRPATAEEMVLLAGRDARGIPRGLVQCLKCREYRGACLADGPEEAGQVGTVYCACENHNRCARCRGLLAEHRLNAKYFDRREKKIWNVAGFCGFSHQCPDREGSSM